MAEIETSGFVLRTHTESHKTIYDLRDSIRNDKGIGHRHHRSQDLETEEATPTPKEEFITSSCIH